MPTFDKICWKGKLTNKIICPNWCETVRVRQFVIVLPQLSCKSRVLRGLSAPRYTSKVILVDWWRFQSLRIEFLIGQSCFLRFSTALFTWWLHFKWFLQASFPYIGDYKKLRITFLQFKSDISNVLWFCGDSSNSSAAKSYFTETIHFNFTKYKTLQMIWLLQTDRFLTNRSATGNWENFLE